MTCPARQFDCGCPDGCCQIPIYEILEASRVASTARVLILSIIAGLVVWAASFGAISMARLDQQETQEAAR